MTTTTEPHVLGSLDAAIDGRVIRPGDTGWHDARRAWNLAIDQHPAAVVCAAGAADIAATVRHARAAGLAVAAQPGGHGAIPYGVDGAVLVRTSALRDIEIDVAGRTARVGAGVKWGTLLSQLDGTGLIALSGSNPDVSVVGYTLGGGLSWFSRKYGPAAQAVRAVELVNADAALVRVTQESDPELFWALRGGGGDFGIVTAIEIDLFPEQTIIGGKLMFPVEQSAAVFSAFTELTQVAPRELTIWAGLMHFPPLPVLPEPIRGRSFAVIDTTYLGTEQAAEALLWTLRAAGTPVQDTVGPVPIDRLGEVAQEPVDPTPGVEHALLLHKFDQNTAARLLAVAGSATGTPLVGVTIRHLGGAFADPDRAFAERHGGTPPGVASRIEQPYLVHALGVPTSPASMTTLTSAFADLAGALAPDAVDQAPFNFLGTRSLRDAYPPEAIDRLQAIKRERDPHGVFRSNRPVLDA
ncbi:FAD-binding oxidoreductase [Nonomuraea jabiensis]|uniref:FAD-binding oxidoreductase n=1 Tax=Nonomuraea jabiensis TaxID=882448 RepID=UPI0036BB0210